MTTDPFITLLSCIDLTSLEGSDNRGKIVELCRKARSYGDSGLPLPAAVCIYPPFIGMSKDQLKGTAIRVAAVAGAFPGGQSPLPLRVEEVRYSVSEGADEIDMVISRGRMLEGDETFVFEEISAIREACKGITLKVILETGELKTPSLIRRASEIAIAAGADFIKTSSGKIRPAATEEAVQIILEVIHADFVRSGKRTGIKPAGGITEPEQALNYFQLVDQILGMEWLNKNLFRIGASRLADRIAQKLKPGTVS